MSHLTKLTMTNAARVVAASATEARRTKLLDKLNEQRAMATAFIEGRTFSLTRKVWAAQEDGSKKKIEREKRLTAWYWQDTAGKFMFEVRYGAQKLELTKGKRAIEVGDKDKLIGVIATVIEAVKSGELDAALNSVVAAKADSPKLKS